MNKEKFKGIFAALLTPFDANGKVNEKALASLITYTLEKGINGFYVNGSTAESFIRIQGGKKVCIDCYKPYSRFQI